VRPEDEGRLRFIALPQHRWAHVHFPRAGSWSARTLAADLLGGEYRQPNDQTAEQLAALKARGWLTSWLVRDPIARFVSVFRYFQKPDRARSKEMRAANADGRLFASIDIFAERAFNDFPCDKHIAPQTGWGAEQCEIIAPLERSGEVVLPIALPRLNANVDARECEVPLAVQQFYANDYAYWQRVCADFDPEEVPARRSHLDGEARRQEKLVRANAHCEVSD
jgi:hypothetical protein